MTTLLIAGSRNAAPPMLRYTERAVWHAKRNGWALIAGDAPGVDYMVALTVYRIGGIDLTVVGITDAPRHRLPRTRYEKFTPASPLKREQYLERDRHMISRADVGLFVWNRKSAGTHAGYQFMTSFPGKRAWLVTVDGKGMGNYENSTS